MSEWLGGEYGPTGRYEEEPSIILWLELPRGVLVGSSLSYPECPVSLAESLQRTMEGPFDGEPRRPARLRVADGRMADELRSSGIPVVVAPVPELDEMYETLAAAMTVPLDHVRRPATSTRAVGRNEPCPCGSGKKYKKCHLDADQAPRRAAAAIESVHQMDFRLVNAMARFASNQFGPDWLGIDFDDEEEDSLDLLLPWTTWTVEAGSRRVADAYLEKERAHLSEEERDWFIAQRASWMSIWEVTAVAPGTIDVRDLLTGETRSIREERGSESVVARDTLLARVIDYHGVSYFGGMHSRALTPMAASAVVDAARKELGLLKESVPIDRLQSPEIGWFLIYVWNDVVEEQDERFSALPDLQNTDGDPLQFVTDSYAFNPGLRAEIEKRLETIEDFADAYPDGDHRTHVFMRLTDDTVTATVNVGEGTLQIETNSVDRADAMAHRVEEACSGLLREHKRKTMQPFGPRAVPDTPEEPAASSPEEQALVRELKEKHYREWLDTEIPALGGETPRDATRSARSRRQLDLLLRDMENHESRQPDGTRFDFASLRRELGLEP